MEGGVGGRGGGAWGGVNQRREGTGVREMGKRGNQGREGDGGEREQGEEWRWGRGCSPGKSGGEGVEKGGWGAGGERRKNLAEL